jgi:carbon monoxide dehydrogenase subunit G
MTGEQLIAAPQQQVWDALNDPAVLKACIPGCESVDKTSDTEFAILMLAAVGPVKARFKGKLTIGELDPPKHYVLSFDGSGGAAGFGKGSASVTLAPEHDGTRLSYVAKAQVGGKLAQVGSRLIDGIATKMAEDFFARFNARFAPASMETSAASSSTTPDAPDGTVNSGADRGATGTWKRLLVAAAAALLIYVAFTVMR